jgi:hypothetical protein
MFDKFCPSLKSRA